MLDKDTGILSPPAQISGVRWEGLSATVVGAASLLRRKGRRRGRLEMIAVASETEGASLSRRPRAPSEAGP